LTLQLAQLHCRGGIGRQVIRTDPALAPIAQPDAHEALSALQLIDRIAGLDRRDARAGLVGLGIDVEHELVGDEYSAHRGRRLRLLLAGHSFVLRRPDEWHSQQHQCRKCRYIETPNAGQLLHGQDAFRVMANGQ
jgi:hypothetical protein